MIHVEVGNSFAKWRRSARQLIARSISPDRVLWAGRGQGTLFGSADDLDRGEPAVKVPPKFIHLAEAAACFDDPARWDVLYRILFRLVTEDRNLLEIESDRDVAVARRMAKGVGRDVHKFHAFVRFRQIESAGEEIFGAWHEPQHFTVERSASFFARRFGEMKFSIFTPKGCAHWDKEKLSFSPPANRSLAPQADEMEEFWLLYYRSIFNPFRLKVSAMKREFPVRHWPTLPEAVLIPELIRSADGVISDAEVVDARRARGQA